MPSRTRVQDLHNWTANKIKRAILDFVQEAQSNRTHSAVRDLLDQGRFELVNRLFSNAVTRLGNVLPNLFVDLASNEVAHLGEKLGSRVHIAKADLPVTISFDPTHERAAALMRTSRLDFIQNLTTEQEAAIRSILANSFGQGSGTRQTARQIVNSIGLTQTQLDAVDNYRALLEQGSADALTRALRDRRFDSTVQNSIDQDTSLTSDQIDRMVERYRQQMVNFRAENIARTESLTVLSQAREEAAQQVMENADIPDDHVERTWNATKDKRTRDSHREMDGQTVGMNEPFTSGLGNDLMYPGDPDASAEERINCRCTLTYRFLSPDEIAAAA